MVVMVEKTMLGKKGEKKEKEKEKHPIVLHPCPPFINKHFWMEK